MDERSMQPPWGLARCGQHEYENRCMMHKANRIENEYSRYWCYGCMELCTKALWHIIISYVGVSACSCSTVHWPLQLGEYCRLCSGSRVCSQGPSISYSCSPCESQQR